MKIGNRLDIYGPSLCPICGNHRETTFMRVSGELVCRDHPGHPLHKTGKHEEARPAHLGRLEGSPVMTDTGLASVGMS